MNKKSPIIDKNIKNEYSKAKDLQEVLKKENYLKEIIKSINEKSKKIH